MPWLHGLQKPVASDIASDEVARRMDSWSVLADVDPECSPGTYPGIAIASDVAPAPGIEIVMASLSHGVIVVDSEWRLIAEAPGYVCDDDGSVDELESVAAGSAFGAPTIAIAATTGGHYETSTWVSLFRVGHAGQLDPVFTGTVEIRRGDDVETGGIFLLPGALIYRHPEGKPAFYYYNPVVRAYLQPGKPIDDSHSEPGAVLSVL